MPEAHAAPHAPQFSESLVVSVHPPAHGVPPPGQLHTPWRQLLPAGQTLKQAPQCALSVAVTTQAPLHDSWSGAQPAGPLPPALPPVPAPTPEPLAPVAPAEPPSAPPPAKDAPAEPCVAPAEAGCEAPNAPGEPMLPWHAKASAMLQKTTTATC